MSMTVFWDNEATPRCRLTKDADLYQAVLAVEGLAPNRDPSLEERAIGILSLDPPTVSTMSLASEGHRSLIDACQRAVQASVAASTGTRGTAAQMSFVYLRTAIAVRGALRMLDEDI